ncbi:MAG: hypothetical protein WHT07_05605 [Desulfobaccales bacterium]
MSKGNNFMEESRRAFRQLQEEMAAFQEEFSQRRLEAWQREMRGMLDGWERFRREWQGSLDQMESQAASTFAEVSARGEAAARELAAQWRTSLAAMAEEVQEWGEGVLEVFDSLSRNWQSGFGGGGGLFSWLGFDFGLGGIFHQGGIVEAHRGMVVGPEALLSDERLVKVQTGEGILPREVMVRLGEENFEALRQGRFGVVPSEGGAAPQITIQVQALDVQGVAGLDWDRLVQRHILPALSREADRRW